MEGTSSLTGKDDAPERYLRLTVRTVAARGQEAGAALMAAGAAGFEIHDRDTDPRLGDAALVTAWLEPTPEARERALTRLAGLDVDAQWEDDPGWADAWRAHFRPVRAGSLTIRAPWNPSSEGLEVVIEPAMAFGTGGHATTRLAAQALEAALAARPGADVLDVGAGSGVLAIAAVKLGAGRAVGVDVDPEAVKATAANAALNGVGGRVLAAAEWPIGAFPVVVANIVSPILLELRERLSGAVSAGGALVLSGILATEADDVVLAFCEAGAFVEIARRSSITDADWVSVTLRRA